MLGNHESNVVFKKHKKDNIYPNNIYKFSNLEIDVILIQFVHYILVQNFAISNILNVK